VTPTAAPPETPTGRADRLPAAALAAGAAALVYSLVQYWGFTVDSVDRYLIVLGGGWAASTIWPAATALPRSPRPVLGLTILLLGVASYPLVWFLQVAVTSGRAILLWWQLAALSMAAAGLLIATHGRPAVRRLAFPPLFLAFALPLPTMMLAPLQALLQGLTTSVSHLLLRLLSQTVERPGDGFVLRMPGGDLGVAEACSGVRSLTALTALAAFVAFRKGFGPVRGTALVALSIPIVVVVNVIRVVLSGLIQEYIGPEYIRGHWHEALGLVMVLVGLGLICLTASALELRKKAVVEHTPADPAAARLPARWFTAAAGVVLVLTAAASVAAAWFGRSAIPDDLPPPDLQSVPLNLGDWEGRELPVPEYVTEMLHQDAAVYRQYRNQIGRGTFVWVIYWSTANQVRGYHHPDVCLPNAGMRPVARTTETVRPDCGGEVPVTGRKFVGDRGTLYALYWTQEGQRVWGEIDEQAAQYAIGGRGLFLRMGEMLRTGLPKGAQGRLVVLIGTDDGSEFAKSETLAFAKKLADEVYRVCPWAAPPIPPDPTD
jgi:EpsI family protein